MRLQQMFDILVEKQLLEIARIEDRLKGITDCIIIVLEQHVINNNLITHESNRDFLD